MQSGGSDQGSQGQVGSWGQIGLPNPDAAVQSAAAAADVSVPLAAAACSAEHSVQYSLGGSYPSGPSFLSAALLVAPFPAPALSGVASDDGGGAGHIAAAADRGVSSTQLLTSCCMTQ